ncbi:MAG: O-antigen ligase family protein [Gallionella sp.]
MENRFGATPIEAYIAIGLLAATGGVLATPLAAGPAVLLGLIATIMLLTKGLGTLKQFGQTTLHARNVLMIAFGGWFLAELISTAINNQHWNNLDYPLRFLLGIGVFWVIRSTVKFRAELFYFGILASAIAAVSIGAYQHYILDIGRVIGVTNHPIYFGNLCVLLCIYAAIVAVTLQDNISPKIRQLLILAIPMLMFAAFLSGSRSSWLGIAGMLVLINWQHVNRIRLIGGGLALAAILAVLFMLVPELSTSLRMTEAIHDVQKIFGGDYSSSIGYRVQMWMAAWLMFLDSPLIGVGSGFYPAEILKLITSGAMGAVLVEDSNTIFNQAHSEVMDILATKGLIGLLAYLSLMFLPLRLFRKLALTKNAEARTFALMGQATIIAFLMFGLTLATFKVQIYCAIFPVLIAMFAAMALNFSDESSTTELRHA